MASFCACVCYWGVQPYWLPADRSRSWLDQACEAWWHSFLHPQVERPSGRAALYTCAPTHTHTFKMTIKCEWWSRQMWKRSSKIPQSISPQQNTRDSVKTQIFLLTKSQRQSLAFSIFIVNWWCVSDSETFSVIFWISLVWQRSEVLWDELVSGALLPQELQMALQGTAVNCECGEWLEEQK